MAVDENEEILNQAFEPDMGDKVFDLESIKKVRCKYGVRKFCPKFVKKLMIDGTIGPMWEICAYICIPQQQLKELKRIRKALEEMAFE